MPDTTDPHQNPSNLCQRALSRWDNEGGSIAPIEHETHEISEIGNAELVKLRVRVIALENLLIAVLAEGSDKQLKLVREMAEYISPRPGYTHHPLTLRAADHMNDLVERAIHFRTVDAPNS